MLLWDAQRLWPCSNNELKAFKRTWTSVLTVIAVEIWDSFKLRWERPCACDLSLKRVRWREVRLREFLSMGSWHLTSRRFLSQVTTVLSPLSLSLSLSTCRLSARLFCCSQTCNYLYHHPCLPFQLNNWVQSQWMSDCERESERQEREKEGKKERESRENETPARSFICPLWPEEFQNGCHEGLAWIKPSRVTSHFLCVALNQSNQQN